MLQRYHDHRELHSFPTRRSSDLSSRSDEIAAMVKGFAWQGKIFDAAKGTLVNHIGPLGTEAILAKVRSEEHTSELQSRLHLVCRLLLEKKKKTQLTCT